MTERDAYRVQRSATNLALEAGSVTAGYKVGLTSERAQQALGGTQPVFGVLFADTVRTVSMSGALVYGDYLLPRLEPEIGLVFGNGLAAGAYDRDDVGGAVTAVVPALEIIDSRYGTWDIGVLDLICDNGGSRGAVLASEEPHLPELFGHDPCCVVRRNGLLAASAAACRPETPLSQALTSVAWLTRTLDGFGLPGLDPGALVLSGTLTDAVDIRPGDHIQVEMDGSPVFDLWIEHDEQEAEGAERACSPRSAGCSRPSLPSATD